MPNDKKGFVPFQEILDEYSEKLVDLVKKGFLNLIKEQAEIDVPKPRNNSHIRYLETLAEYNAIHTIPLMDELILSRTGMTPDEYTKERGKRLRQSVRLHLGVEA